MQKLIVILSDIFDTYQLQEEIKQPIGFLKLYLNDIPLWGIASEIQWAQDPKDCNRETNSMWLRKKDHFILIGSSYSDPKSEIQYFKILIPEFIKVLTEWEKLAKIKTQKIIITQADDGTMTIEGE